MKSTHLFLSLALAAVAASADSPVDERPPERGLEEGRALFLFNCAPCHQPTGLGMKGVFPPLAGSDFIADNSRETVLGTVLGGRTGKLVVNGVEYNNVMPAMSHLKDEQIAQILSFVYESWENPGGMIAAHEVAEVRARLGVPTDPAQGERHPRTNEAEMTYQGAPSVAGAEGVEMVVNPDAPPISKEEFSRATKIFFERCAGCHGVLRKGA
ncbi:MAG: cytochrome c, partial [Acidobacteria bacterium]|nr:cytochrome c [Acidobacteriota bacterium]